MKLFYKGCLYESEGLSTWFGNSKVTDQYGKPLEVYHGTNANFSIFSKSKSYSKGFAGKGFYFTDDPRDAEENYTSLGGNRDLHNKVELELEQLVNEPEKALKIFKKAKLKIHFDIDDYDALENFIEENKEIITKTIYNQYSSKDTGPNIMPVYLRIVKPFYIGLDKQWFETEYVEDENGDIIDEKGTALKMYKCILKIVGNEGANLWSNMELDPEFTGDTFRDKFISSWYDTIGDGKDPEEVFRQIIKCFGFDGIIMDAGRFSNMQHTRGTKHYIVFSPNQIKSVYNRNPTKNSDITKE